MRNRYKKTYRIRSKIEQYIGNFGHTRVYRKEGQIPRCGTPFFNVDFRGNLKAFRFFCQSFFL